MKKGRKEDRFLVGPEKKDMPTFLTRKKAINSVLIENI